MSTLHLQVPARAEAIPLAAQRAARLAARAGLDAQGCFEVQVVVAEALNNIVLHAMAGDRAYASIEMHGGIVADALTITILDNGMPLRSRPDRRLPNARVENGRGWPIIIRWSDSVQYRHARGRNRLTLRKRLPRPGNAPA